MAIPRTHGSFVLVIFMVIGLTTMNMEEALGQHPKLRSLPARCWGVTKFVVYCSFYLTNLPRYALTPSERCCAQAKKTDILLFCKTFMTKSNIIYYAPEVAHVARYCYNPLPNGTKCGSKFQFLEFGTFLHKIKCALIDNKLIVLVQLIDNMLYIMQIIQSEEGNEELVKNAIHILRTTCLQEHAQ